MIKSTADTDHASTATRMKLLSDKLNLSVFKGVQLDETSAEMSLHFFYLIEL